MTFTSHTLKPKFEPELQILWDFLHGDKVFLGIIWRHQLQFSDLPLEKSIPSFFHFMSLSEAGTCTGDTFWKTKFNWKRYQLGVATFSEKNFCSEDYRVPQKQWFSWVKIFANFVNLTKIREIFYSRNNRFFSSFDFTL